MEDGEDGEDDGEDGEDGEEDGEDDGEDGEEDEEDGEDSEEGEEDGEGEDVNNYYLLTVFDSPMKHGLRNMWVSHVGFSFIKSEPQRGEGTCPGSHSS